MKINEILIWHLISILEDRNCNHKSLGSLITVLKILARIFKDLDQDH